jgi:hypothetical protein
MDSMALRHLGWKTITYDEVTGKGASRIPFSAVDIGRATEYAAEDADCALSLHEALYEKIAADEKLKFVYEKIEMPALPVLFRHGAQRRAARCGEARRAKPRARQGNAGGRAEGLRGRRPAVQP